MHMNIKSILLSTLLTATLFTSITALADQVFGKGANTESITKVSDILATPNEFMEKELTIQGTIVKVCKKRGCWMSLTSDKKFQTFRVKVRDGDMVFPMTAMGKTAYATGELQALPLSLERTKQYLAYQAQEQQEEFDPESVTEAITVYQLSPNGVTIKD